MGDFFDDYLAKVDLNFMDKYLKKCIDDKVTEAWKNCANYTGFTGAAGVYGPLVKGIHKIFEDAYVPMNVKEKTFLEEIVEIENED